MAVFPKEFVWGAATAAYQIEGGAVEDGKGRSIWDVFSHTPGRTYRGETGDTACDSYHRWREDIELLKSMHLKAYRFSVAWTRIAPTGGTDWNEKGFAYYDGLVNTLLEAGIEPYITLYHWDLPQALEEKGAARPVFCLARSSLLCASLGIGNQQYCCAALDKIQQKFLPESED